MEATDASRLVCVVVVSYQEYSLTPAALISLTMCCERELFPIRPISQFPPHVTCTFTCSTPTAPRAENLSANKEKAAGYGAWLLHADLLLGSPFPFRTPAARVGLCASVPGHFAPHPMRCSALVHSARRTAIAPRAARSERLERHESEVHTRNAGRATAQRDESPPCLLRSCDARSEPAPCSSQFTMLTLARRRLRLADPNLGGARGAAAASCGLGLKLRMPRVGAAPLSPPLLMHPQRRSQSRP